LDIIRKSVSELSQDPANSRKEVTCVKCGRTRFIRKDSNSAMCRSCASSKTGPRPSRRTGEQRSCKVCGTGFYARACESTRRFCSPACHDKSRQKNKRCVNRCEQCEKDFNYVEKPNSNDKGKFCSLKCRNKSYLGKYHGNPARNIKTHRPGWASISRRFRRDNNFCSGCGKDTGRLVAHHVDPYWRSKNNDNSNLVTLCPRCHGRAELLSETLSRMKPKSREIAVAMIQADLHDWWHVFQGRRILQECK
jgi:hypothetical protein